VSKADGHRGSSGAPEDRARLKEAVLDLYGGSWLELQAGAVRLYGAAGGIMARDLLNKDGKGWDPEGWVYMTKAEGVELWGLSPKSQDGGRKRLEDAGVMEVERRHRLLRDGTRRKHPSKVLHYRLDLDGLFKQMREDATLYRKFNDADSDARTRGLGPSSTREGTLEDAVTGAPYTEVTSEETTEGLSEVPLTEGGDAKKSRPHPPPQNQEWNELPDEPIGVEDLDADEADALDDVDADEVAAASGPPRYDAESNPEYARILELVGNPEGEIGRLARLVVAGEADREKVVLAAAGGSEFLAETMNIRGYVRQALEDIAQEPLRGAEPVGAMSSEVPA
jgi:hypothetical protein